jgi:mannose-1-phosphate guanylyltransferase/mannose-6-phosphate isomerase
MIHPVILCGGNGTRLWPLSNKAYPKQFIKVLGNELSLLQLTVSRFLGEQHFSVPIFVTNVKYENIIKEQLADIGLIDYIIIFEPESKNTAPAIAIAANYILEYFPNDLMLVVPSDSVIEDFSIFLNAMKDSAIYLKQNNHFILFGIEPTYPELGFGYIKSSNNNKNNISKIELFAEKPNEETAISYLNQGYLWNSGMFMFRPQLYLDELAVFEPLIYTSCNNAYINAVVSGKSLFVNKEDFALSPSLSIDYAVMERTSFSSVINIKNVIWNDVGSWASIYNLSPKDENGNVFVGSVKAINCKNCYVYSNKSIITISDISNLIIISIDDIYVSIPLYNNQSIKTLYNLVDNDII